MARPDFARAGITLSDLTRKAAQLSYAHEIDGLIPLSRDLATIREALPAPEKSPSPNVAPAKPARRHTNCSLWRESEGELDKIKEGGRGPSVGEIVHLSVQISPDLNLDMARADDVSLIEEAFRWEDGQAGVRLQVAVVGIDFAVIGHPVQDLWLPRAGATDPLWFAVSPHREGASRIRVCVYYKNAVIQTVRLTAWVENGTFTPPATRREQMGLDAEGAGEREPPPYFLLTEFGDVNQTDAVVARGNPALSIVANDSAGRAIIAVKIGDEFAVDAPPNLGDLIEDMRNALTDAAFDTVGPSGELVPKFGTYLDHNQGDEPTLRKALATMARRGVQMYQTLFAYQTRQRLERSETLGGAPAVIEVAHVLIEKSIPWSLLYGQDYDADDTRAPAEDRVCLAPLRVEVTRCGSHASCPLYPQGVAAEPTADPSIACPRHLWGLRHWIETPIEQHTQAQPGAREAEAPAETPLPDAPAAGPRPPRVLVALNRKLLTNNNHVAELKSTVLGAVPHADWRETYDRASILAELRQVELSVIYFLCHAAPRLNGSFDPHLDFTDSTTPQIITATQLVGKPWLRRPFVILNGCNTGGMSPKALSPFLTTLVRDRRAAGVLGTEIPVSPQLAREVGRLFLEQFLARKTAAEALRQVRWTLLSRNNPFGLVYTLYGRAALTLGA